MLKVQCDHCGAPLQFNEWAAGTRRRCPCCRAPLRAETSGVYGKERPTPSSGRTSEGAGGKPATGKAGWLWAVGAVLILVHLGLAFKDWIAATAEERKARNTVTDFSAFVWDDLSLTYSGTTRLENVEVDLTVSFKSGQPFRTTQSWATWEPGEKKSVAVPGYGSGGPEAGRVGGGLRLNGAVESITLHGKAAAGGKQVSLEASFFMLRIP